MSTTGKIVKGLDIDPLDDPEVMFAQPDEPAEHIDPARTDDPLLRSLLIELRRRAGLTDFPAASDRRSAAD